MLLGLVGVLAFMPVVIFYDQQQMRTMKDKIIPQSRAAAGFGSVPAAGGHGPLEIALQLDFSTTNKLFNPVQWQKQADGTLLKIATGHEVGPGAAVVTKITPLYYTISLDSVNDQRRLGARYVFSIEDQSAAVPAQRHKRPHYASKGGNETVADKIGGRKK